MVDKIAIEKNLLCCKRMLEDKGLTVVGIFLYGSQNYNLDYEGSDIDLKAIVIPSINDIVFNNKPVSTTIDIPDGLCDIKDIRLMVQSWRKQNVNFMELLFTEYSYVNPLFYEFFRPLLAARETIVRYNEKRAVDCLRGFVYEKYYRLFKDTPSQHDEVTKYGYAAKQRVHMERLASLLEHYMKREPSTECLMVSPEERQKWIDLKTYSPSPLSVDEVKERSQKVIEIVEDNILNAEKYYGFTPSPQNEEVDKILNTFIEKCLKFSFKKELEEDNE